MRQRVRAQGFARSAAQTVGSTVGASAMLAILMLVLAKFMPKEDYGYYQLYLFYATYFGYLSFGVADGLFLRFSGVSLTAISRSVVASHFRFLLAFLLSLAVTGCFFSTFLLKNTDLRLVIALACVSSFFYLLRSFITFVYQAANVSSVYARATVMERFVHVFLSAMLLFGGCREFPVFILTDVIARIVGLSITVFTAWEFIFAEPLPLRSGLREIRASMSSGVFINLAALAAVFVTAVSRWSAERGFGIAIFAEISVAFSLQNIVLTVVTPLSVVILPNLRRQPPDKWSKTYLSGLRIMMPALMASLAVYVPMKILCQLWLPQYIHLSAYVAALFPMIIFESRTRIFAIPFMQVLRKERQLASVNFACLILAAIFSWACVSLLDSPLLLVLSLTLVVAIRAVALEICIEKQLHVTRINATAFEILTSCLFLIAATSGVGSSALWSLAILSWAGYLLTYRSGFLQLAHRVRGAGS